MEEMQKESYRKRYNKILPLLNEKEQRIVLGSDAEVFGYGGVSLVSELSGVSRPTIIEGKKQIKQGPLYSLPGHRIRKTGGGRKKSIDNQPGLQNELELMME